MNKFVLLSTVDDKLNDPTDKCTFDRRNTENALEKYRVTN